MLELLAKLVTESWLVLGQMGPYLLFGFLAAGIMSVCISPEWVQRHLGGRGLGAVLKASLFGVPLPLCSCSVIPVSASMHRHGASRAATTSFLLSTPQTGVDSIAVTYALLGPVFAVFRPVAAFITGLIGGALVQWFDTPKGSDEAAPAANECADACCADRGQRGVVGRVLHYGFVTLPRDLAAALLIGVVIAGAMAALLPADSLKLYLGAGVGSILLLMLAGVPVYVCATASVPLAAVFMHAGASPGAALAFLIAGPATNAATFTTIWKVLGRRTAGLYLVTIAVSAVACGLLLDGLFKAVGATAPQLGSLAHHGEESGWLTHASAVALLVVMAYSYWATRPRRAGTAPPEAEAEAPAGVGRAELQVSGMTCDHCVGSVQRALDNCPGVRSAAVDLKAGRAVVSGDGLAPDQLVAAVVAAGFAAKPWDEPPTAEPTGGAPL